MSIEHNIKFVPTTDLVCFTLPLLPEGEWSTNQLLASQQEEESPSAASDLTCISTSTQAPVLTPSKIPVPIQPRPTTWSMMHAAGSSTDTGTSSNTCTVTPGSPEGTMPEGEPQGESTLYITLDSNNADFIFHTNFNHDIAAALEEVQDDPKTLHEARSQSDWQRWKEAMEKEMDTLQKAGTWATVPQPCDKNIIGSKWVFHVKHKADGSINKYKAWLVAKGFTQVYGIDYFDTYLPVAKLSSIHLILALAARHDWEVESFDFNGAYLNGELSDEEEIFMQEPPGYETKEGGPSIKWLLKLLYGLKQAGQKWYKVLCCTLTDLVFRVSNADPGIFHACIGEHALILAVHVDDCIMTGGSIKLIRDYKHKLNKQHTLTDLGPIHWLLGIKISRDCAAHTISLLQMAYIKSIIDCFSLTDAKLVNTPMIPGAVYSKQDAPSSPAEAMHMKKTPYREAISSLMYTAVATHPDIAYAVSTLSQFLDNPGEAHWNTVKRVFRYLSCYERTQRHLLIGDDYSSKR